MTPQEAMEIRKNPHFEDVDNEELSRCIDEALEKQIPKKAKNISTTVYYRQGLCPNCNALLKNTINILCSDCGQALDWSDN